MQRRRDFLVTSAGLGAGLASGTTWAQNTPSATQVNPALGNAPDRLPDCPRGLIVVELAGGNDPFNTLVPLNDSGYRAARPTLAVEATEVLPICGEFGWHRALEPLLELRGEGSVAVFREIGFETGLPSHATAAERWRHTFRAHGRPLEFAAPRDDWSVQMQRAVERVAGTSQPIAVGTTLSGFDTHTRQAELHPQLLAELAMGLHAAWRALTTRGLAEQTRIVVVSEFGRTLQENVFGGTDHGPRSVAFVVGRGVGNGNVVRAPLSPERFVADCCAVPSDFA